MVECSLTNLVVVGSSPVAVIQVIFLGNKNILMNILYKGIIKDAKQTQFGETSKFFHLRKITFILHGRIHTFLMHGNTAEFITQQNSQSRKSSQS